MTTQNAPAIEAAYGSLLSRLQQPVTEATTTRLDYVPQIPTRREYKPNRAARRMDRGTCIPDPAPRYKGADCQTPGRPSDPGTHAFCDDAACACTCHGRIARQTRPAPAAVAVQPGTYTVGSTDSDYHTIRVRDAEWAREKGVWGVEATTQTVAFLSGPDNEGDYTSFGFLTGATYRPFKRYADNAALRRAVLALTDGPEAAGLAYAERSGNCYRCSRKLTVPTSLAQGLGPECAKKVA